MAVNEECVNKLMACQIKEEFQECMSWLGHETHYKLKTAVQRQSIIPNCLLIGMRLEDVFPERIFHAPWLETALCILRPFKMPTSASCHMGMHMGLSPALCPLCSNSKSLGHIFVSHHFDLKMASSSVSTFLAHGLVVEYEVRQTSPWQIVLTWMLHYIEYFLWNI